ncbi:MAG: hypothetical protein NZ693_09000 [Thermoflexales bacterium]|nr:hypothetical protein [Thermoflexales bacterium]
MAEHVCYQIVESESRVFTFRAHLPSQSIPPLGALVQVETTEGQVIFGVVYRALVLRDDFLEQLGALNAAEVSSFFGDTNQFNVPVELSVASVGYRQPDGTIRQALPLRPPVFLDRVALCTQDEIVQFTRQLDYLYLLFNAVTDDDLIVEHVKLLVQAHQDKGNDFLLTVTRKVVRQLLDNPLRADRILSYLE